MCVVDDKEDVVEDSVDNSVDFGDKHLTHFTKAVDCCLKERSKQNKCADDDKDNSVGNSVEDSVDGGDKHLTHLTQAVSCCLKARSEKNKCADDGREGVDNSVDGGDKHLTHLTQFENNVNLGGCDKHLTQVVKNSPESLIHDITGHVTHVNYFGKMSASKNAILCLRGDGLKDDSDYIDNGQKDNDEKNNGGTNNQSPSQGVSFSSTVANQNTSSRSQNHHTDYHNNF
eukprot:4756388-Ditylum_brightwellii.AAC.1